MPPRRSEVDDAADFIGLLKALVSRDVEFIAVGDVAGILAGSPVVTVVLEVTCQPSPENLSRLHEALETLNARHYVRCEPGAELGPSELSARQRHKLVTDLGRIDVVQEFGHGLDYDALKENTIDYEIDGLTVKALSLKTLIDEKEHSPRPEDRYSLLFLKKLAKMTGVADEGLIGFGEPLRAS